MMELAIKTMTADRTIGSQRAERETIRSLLGARMNAGVVWAGGYLFIGAVVKEAGAERAGPVVDGDMRCADRFDAMTAEVVYGM